MTPSEIAHHYDLLVPYILPPSAIAGFLCGVLTVHLLSKHWSELNAEISWCA